MTKRKTSVTVDSDKADEALQIAGTDNFSAVVDRALDALIRQERARRDVEAYTAIPLTAEERAVAEAGYRPALDDDDVDWEALYPVDDATAAPAS